MNNISDTELNFTYLFYKNLPQIKKIVFYGWFFALSAVFLFSFFIFTIELLKFSKHNLYLTKTLSEIKSYQDSYLSLRPKEIEVVKSQVLKLDNRRSDIVFLLNNPNRNWFIWSAQYKLKAQTNWQDIFILPGKRWLNILAVNDDAQLAFNLEFKDIIWRKLSPILDLEKIKALKFKTEKIIFVPKDSLGQNRAYITILNNSPFSFKQVEAQVLIYQNDQLLSLAQGTIDNFKTFERREIFLGFGFADIGLNPDIQVFIYVNVFDDSQILPFEAVPQEENLEEKMN